MAKLIAIDLGSHSVKLAVYEGAFGRYQLEQLLSARVDQDQDDAPTQQDQLDALKPLLEDVVSTGRATYATAWPTQQASLRNVRLPFADKAQIDKVLPFEVEGMVPFDMDEVELRHHILRIDPGDSQILVAMVERQPLADWLAALHAAGADPRTVELDAYALGALATPGIQAVVDIGHSRTLVSLCQDGQVVAARALSLGGRDLTLALCRAQGISWAQAEDRKHIASIGATTSASDHATPGASGHATPISVEWEGDQQTQPGVDKPDQDSADDGQILRDAFMPLLAELRSTLFSFEDSLGLDVDEVLLVGGSSHIGGLRTLLAATFGVPVRMADPSAIAQGRDDAGAWALIHALGTRAARGKPSSMDLRQGKLAFKGDLYLVRQVGIYGGVFAACALLAGTAMFGVRTIQLDRQLTELDQDIAQAVVDAFPGEITVDQVDSSSRALAIMTEKSLEVTTRVDALGSIVSAEPPITSLLRDLSAAMPPAGDARVDVKELTITTTSISLTAETDGYEAATRIESSLQAMDRFKKAHKDDEKKSRGGGISFKVTIPRTNDSVDSEEG